MALRLLCDREAEIEAFVPRQYWTVHAELAAADGVPFPATLCRLDGMEIGEAGLATGTIAENAANRIRESALTVNGGGNMYRGGGAKMYHGLGGSLSA